MSVSELKKYILKSKYARHNKKLKRRETYGEAIGRVRTMMLEEYPQAEEVINWAYDEVEKETALGSQRAMQFGGKPIQSKHERIFNCLGEETEFITSHGVRSFRDFKDGDKTVVLTAAGRWKKAVVRYYGRDKLFPITFKKRGLVPHVVWATKDHRWLLNDETSTTSLKVGDLLSQAPAIFDEFDYDESPPDERMWWAYGYVFGDGTTVKNSQGEYRYSMVRLCGKDKAYESRFKELGFKTSKPASFNGETMAYTGHYLKEAPDPALEHPRHIRAFVRGYLDADGGKHANKGGLSRFASIQATGQYHIDFIRNAFPVAGVYIQGEKDLTGQQTNFSVRPYTVRFSIASAYGKNHTYRVASIGSEARYDNVWCLEVEDDHSFMLSSGIPTGNCTATYADRLRFFQETFFLLLCGCGTGFSVQKHHVACLPDFAVERIYRARHPFTMGSASFVVPDTIEGWSDALGVLISSYFPDGPFPWYRGHEVVFDYSKIRKKGSPLSSGAGRAPGPEPLMRSLEKIRGLLERCLLDGQTRLRPIDVYDIVMHASDAVLAGGVRRSATICVFSPDDHEMATAKVGNWMSENPQRARSNNSALLVRDRTTYEKFEELITHSRGFGEPGFLWADSTEWMTNPCQPSWAKVLTPDGIREIGDVHIGDRIWSKQGWTIITRKWSTGTNEVYRYGTTGGVFYGTEGHRLVSEGVKVEAGSAESIDTVVGPRPKEIVDFDHQVVMDGLVIGDGPVHKASNNLIYLNVGMNDDYYNTDVGSLLLKHRPGISRYAYEVQTNITSDELPYMWKRRVPKRYLCGNEQIVRSFLRGLFTANGSVCGHRVTLKSTSLGLIEDVQMMLSSIGIRSYYTTNKSTVVEFPNRCGHECNQSYDLNISIRSHGLAFSDCVGFLQSYKMEKLQQAIGMATHEQTKVTYDIISKELISIEETFDMTVDNESHTYWTQGCDVSNCSEISFWPRLTLNGDSEYLESILRGYQGPVGYDDATGQQTVSGWQFCVSGDTRLITRQGIETIQDAVGREIEIWNGEQWSKATPFETGRDRKLYRVTFGDGSFLDVTDNHRFLVADRINKQYREVQTKDLLTHSRYPLHVPRTNIYYEDCGGYHEHYAYEYGFIAGDGSVRENHSPRSTLYGAKIKLPLRGRRGEIRREEGHGVDSQCITFEEVDIKFAAKVKRDAVPVEIFGWDYDSIICFISGLADADGSRQANGCRIYGSKRRMRDLQLLLTKVGINSSFNLMSEAGEFTNKGQRINDVWYVQIPNPSRLKCYRLGIMGGSEPRFKGKHQIIRSVVELPGLHTTYCLTEPHKHRCVFNNVLTMQCNLSSINGNKVQTPDDFYKACRVAAIIGTLQAGFTNFPYLGRVTEEIVRKEALLGVSITSIMSNPQVMLKPEVLRRGASIVLETNADVAHLLGINPCARGTCLKPEGTGTLMLGSLGCGAHAWPFRKGIKNVQANVNEPVYEYFRTFNPQACERSVWCRNGSTDVISFPVEAPDTAIIESDLTALEFLGVVKNIYENWVVPGKRPERCTQEWLHHSVSNTVKVKEHEWPDVTHYIYDNRRSFAGISLLPFSGDKDYRQAPNIGVYDPGEIAAMYGEDAYVVAYNLLGGVAAHFAGDVFKACDTFMLEAEPEQSPDVTSGQRAWCDAAKQALLPLLQGERKRATYLLKDIHNWRHYMTLKEIFREVDYESLIEIEDETNLAAEAACAGGACLI